MKGYKEMIRPNEEMRSIIGGINGVARKNFVIYVMIWGSIGWLVGIWYMISLIEDIYDWVCFRYIDFLLWASEKGIEKTYKFYDYGEEG